MSAITGIFYRDGREVCHDQMKKMNDILSHRGPDNSDIWVDGPVGFGHQMLWTTSESIHENLPFADDNAKITITADARIDNRIQLFNDLKIESSHCVSDSELILRSYQKWGEDCPEKLLGDFAFAIWDEEKQVLFCARDHIGVKAFYYYLSDRLFLFATEIKAIISLPEIPCELNEEDVANYIMSISENREITFYKKILRLPAAHKMVISSNEKKIIQYWELDSNKKLILNSDEEYQKAFLEIFQDAIECRLRSSFPLGFELSGGLDSSSVVCTAKKIMAQSKNNKDLNTFSATFETTPECDEQQYINTITKSGGIKAHMVKADLLSPLLIKDNIFWHLDEPRASPNLYINWNLHQCAKKNGVKVMLNGFDGDTTISHGERYAVEYFLSLRLLKAIQGMYYRSKRIKFNFLKLFVLTFLFPLAPNFLIKVFMNNNSNKNSLINEKFAKETNVKELFISLNNKRRLVRNSREFHYLSLDSGGIQRVLEILDKSAAAANLEARYPFFDKRLMEFCLALPVEQKINKGWDRFIMRRSMEQILPSEIQWRATKANLGPNFQKNFLLFEKSLIKDMVYKQNQIIENYVNLDVLREMYCNYSSQRFVHASKIFMVVNLMLWLEYQFTKINK